jgi:hypothetical protein
MEALKTTTVRRQNLAALRRAEAKRDRRLRHHAGRERPAAASFRWRGYWRERSACREFRFVVVGTLSSDMNLVERLGPPNAKGAGCQ